MTAKAPNAACVKVHAGRRQTEALLQPSVWISALKRWQDDALFHILGFKTAELPRKNLLMDPSAEPGWGMIHKTIFHWLLTAQVDTFCAFHSFICIFMILFPNRLFPKCCISKQKTFIGPNLSILVIMMPIVRRSAALQFFFCDLNCFSRLSQLLHRQWSPLQC